MIWITFNHLDGLGTSNIRPGVDGANETARLDGCHKCHGATLQTLLGDVINIVLGTVFLTDGATACAIAAIRGRRGVRILVWWGIFSGRYGLQKLGQTPTILTLLPHSFMSAAP